MFRLLKDALAAPSPPSPPQARRSSTTTSKADQPAERVTDPDVEEMKRDSKEDDWEVKRVISAVKEWADADEGNHVHSLSALDALLSQLQQLIRLPETEGHVTTPVADFPSTLRIRQTMFRKEGGFESFLKAVDKVSKLEVETQAHLSDIAPQIEAVKELKLEDAKDSVQTPEDGEGTQQEQEVSPVFVLSRLLSVLHCCLSNERNRIYFDNHGGWSAYEPALKALCYSTRTEGHVLYPDMGAKFASPGFASIPDSQLLGLLWSCACNQDQTLISLFQLFASSLQSQGSANSETTQIHVFPTPLPISSNLVLTNPHLLPIIMNITPLPYTATASSTYPSSTRRSPLPYPLTEPHLQLERLTYRILIALVQSSWSNLFKTQAVLPSLYEAVLTRLYGPSSRKREESKMAKSLDLEPALRKGVTPGREKEQALPKFLVSRYTDNTSPGGTTHTGLHQDDVFSPTTTIQERGTNDVVHQPADQTLRPILLKLLRRLVEAGVPVEYAYMLYRLAKKNDAPTALAKIKSIQAVELGLSTQNEVLSSTESSPSKSPSGKRTRPAKPMNLKLALNVLAGSAKNGPSVLDKDVLEILRHGSSRRWPDMFMFSPGLGGCEGGLSCSNLGKTWPTSAKGFYFMAWVYVEHLCGPITLLHVYETKRTLLRVRILPNSQVGVIASRPEGNQEPLEEVIFSGSDSLVPHQKWIHIALAGRQPRTPASSPTEVKLLINGRRTQAMKCEYPKPTSMANQPGAEAVMVAVGKDGQRVPVAEDGLDFDSLGLERSTWFLGHSMLLGEYVGDDLALLLYYLGPRYQSNMREALGRFLTYEGATALNIYLHNMVHTTKKEGKAALPANSYLIKAIKQGHIFPEEAILFSYSANNVDIRQDPSGPLLEVPNAALPSSIRLNERKGYHATVQGDVKAYNPMCLDEAMFVVGGPAVALKLVELASSPDELQSAITLLSECVKESWKASEEAERMRKPVNFKVMGKGLLRLKMQDCMTVPVFKTLYQFLGVNFEKPEHSTVFNSTAYKALALRFDLWARAPVEVLELYFAHFQHLLTVSRFKRFNVLHCLKKAGLVRRLLHALKANTFDSTLTPQILETMRIVLSNHWSIQDSVKPVLSYLIASLCSNSAVIPMSSTGIQPSIAQATAISVYQVLAQILESSMNLTKLVTALPLHRVLIVILSSNPFAETISISLAIFKSAITHSPHEQFEKRFSAEGGYDLFARLLPANWSTKIQDNVFAVILDEPKAHISPAGTKLIFGIIFTALERLMQIPEEETPVTPKPVFTRARSATSHISLPAVLVDVESGNTAPEEALESLLEALNEVLARHPHYREMISRDQVEAIIPTIADYISMSATPISVSDTLLNNRRQVEKLLENLRERCIGDGVLQSQITALIEQIRIGVVSPRGKNTPLAFSPSSFSLSQMQNPSSYTSQTAFSLGSSSKLNPLSSGRTTRKTAMGRTRSAFDRKVPLIRRLTGDFGNNEKKDKDLLWKQGIISAESTKFSKTVLDSKDYWQRVANRDWPRQLAMIDSEIGLWPDLSIASHWRLDGSEGPLRKRIKLERATFHIADKAAAFYPKSHRNAIPRTDELNSAASYIGTTGGQDPFAEAMGDAANQAVEVAKAKNDIQHEAELPMVPGEDEDDDDEDTLRDVPEEDGKKRRIAEMLATGDVVEDAFNISRVVGVDALPGLLIIGKQNLYLFDGLAKTTNGDIVTADEAPSDLFSIPSGTIAQIDIDDMQSHSWNYNEIVESHKRWYLFRDVAIEFLFADKRNFLCVLRNKKERQTVLQRISGKNDPNAIKQSALGTFLLDTVQKAMVKAGSELDSLTRRWQTREISNFAYLQVLNQFANRTPNDVTQYPVFPWVVADYTSPILNLSKPSSFRDLSLPMGALTPDRREAANERYLQTESTGDSPFQFGTHYSSSMIVCSFNIRLSPFTEMFLALQGGSFDLADRLFSSVAKTWASASEDNRGDVRELIPELYYSPLMLLNLNHHQFGKKQVTEEDVDDVELPPWALGNALLFTHRLREALESDYVSRHLPSWIDLVFGFKQHDKDSFTCYHPLSYKNAIDLDAIENEAEKAASVGIIHNFGQTPYQIFKEAHPHRYMGGKTTLPAEKRFGVAEHWMVLMRSALPVVESATPIRSIVTPPTPEFAPSVLSSNRIPFPEAANVYLHFGNLDKSIRKYHVSGRLYGIVEYTDACLAVFVNAHLLATTSERGLISLWKLEAANGSLAAIANTQFTIDALLRGHEGRLHHLEASDTWSTLVSCGEDGTAIVWDMNRKRFLHRLLVQPEEPVKCAAISESEGHIVLVTDTRLHMYTLNGAHIASASVPPPASSSFTFGVQQNQMKAIFCGGVSFYLREFSKDGVLFAVGLGNNVSLWRLCPGSFAEPAWTLREQKRFPGPEGTAEVTAVRFIEDHLYAAFAPLQTGHKHALYQWSLPEGARHVPDHASGKCMADCSRTFGILEPRRYCGGCGGTFCSQDALQIDGFDSRYCPTCRVTLALGAGTLGSRAGSRRGSSAFVDMSRRGSLI